jgi:hypothetical protein
MLQIAPGEAVAVNSVLQLHRLLAGPVEQHQPTTPIDAVLDCVASLRPKIFTIVEQEADHNKLGFIDRFTEALFYYSAVFDFDSLNASGTSRFGEAPPRGNQPARMAHCRTWFTEEERPDRWGPPVSEPEKERGRSIDGADNRIIKNDKI